MIGSDTDFPDGPLSSGGDLGTQVCPSLGFTISTLWLLRLPPGITSFPDNQREKDLASSPGETSVGSPGHGTRRFCPCSTRSRPQGRILQKQKSGNQAQLSELE